MPAEQESQSKPLPQPPYRYEGVGKVTGKIKYAAEFKGPFPTKDLLYGYMVQSTIPCGTIVSMDEKAASRAPGVVAVLTPFNAPKLQVGKPKPPTKRSVTILQDAEVDYNGQPIALVVARSLTEAMAAAALLDVKYAPKPAKLDFLGRLGEAHPPRQRSRDPNSENRGDVAQALHEGAVTLDETYLTPVQNHNPMEPHATIAWWADGKLRVYDSTQGVTGSRTALARILNLAEEDVEVMSPVVGGGFGCKGSSWSHVFLAAMAARIVGKPVKVVLGREQMFGPVGARPTTHNRLQISADREGRISGMRHDAIIHSSVLEDFIEESVGPTRVLYASKANETSLKCVEMNVGVPTFMRAPGESTGTAVLEIAMDELAGKLGIDPVQLRLVNYAERDPSKNTPWSSKHLREAYQQAGDRFGWERVKHLHGTPGTVTEGNNLIGYGMATATYPAIRSAANASAQVRQDGRVEVASGTQDIGTGMYTIMQQTAAAAMGVSLDQITVRLGDSSLPKAPVSGGSQSTASVGPAVEMACEQLKLRLADLAVGDAASPVHGALTEAVAVKGGRIFLTKDESTGEALTALLARQKLDAVKAEGSAEPGEDESSMTTASWGAVFAEVAVDKTTRMVAVRRIVATYDIGTLLNQKTGMNQLMGGLVWAVGFALEEETHFDPNTGRTVNESLAEYHVPVNRDINTLDVTVLNIPDTEFNPQGARGIGEIGITGAMAAIANAVYNATGKRVREYPITPDKLL